MWFKFRPFPDKIKDTMERADKRLAAPRSAVAPKFFGYLLKEMSKVTEFSLEDAKVHKCCLPRYCGELQGTWLSYP